MITRLAFVCIFLLSTTIARAAEPWTNWQSSHYQDHKLAGKLYVPGLNRPIDLSDGGQAIRRQILTSYAQAARYVLIGEQHDNPDHHLIQAWLIDEIVKDGRRPSVVLEMVPQSYAAQISDYDLNKDPQLDDFAKRLDWEKRGWFSWDIYRPVGLAAARNGLRMVAGNLDRDRTRDISKRGTDALSQEERERFALNEAMDPKLRDGLAAELSGSHCGLLPKSALPSMALVQRARDGVMADAMIAAGSRNGSVLIAGNGHVRKDRGVPMVLAKRLPGHDDVTLEKDGTTRTVRTPRAQNFAIGLIEVQPGKNDPADYGLSNAQGTPLYDIVMFTPKADITDHCAEMRKRFAPEKKDPEKKKSP